MILRLVGAYIVACIAWQLLLVFAVDLARTIARPATMLHDEDGSGDWSMTRVLALMFGVAFIREFKLPVTWPDVVVAGLILYNIPIKGMLSGRTGPALVRKLIEAFAARGRGSDQPNGANLNADVMP